jgi:hypothetical protein
MSPLWFKCNYLGFQICRTKSGMEPENVKLYQSRNWIWVFEKDFIYTTCNVQI